MSKVTSKLQVTIPKAIAVRFGIGAGDVIEWVITGEGLRVIAKGRPRSRRDDLAWKLRMFDAATARQRRRDAAWKGPVEPAGRGWNREDLYHRGRSD